MPTPEDEAQPDEEVEVAVTSPGLDIEQAADSGQRTIVGTVRRELRQLPLGVWAATACLVGLTLLGTFLVPLYEIPDERFHVDMVLATMDGDGYPRVGERPLSSAVEASGRLLRRDVATTAPLPDRPPGHLDNPCDPDVRPLPACEFAPTLVELGNAYGFRGAENRMTAHAPLYYLVAGQAVATTTALTMTDVPHDTQAWLYRLVSLVLMASMPVLLALAGREAGLDRTAMVLLALAAAAITGIGLRNAPIANNDNLLAPLLTGVLVLLLRIRRVGPSRRNLVATGLLLGLGLLTKAFAMVLALVLPVSLVLLLPATTPLRERVVQAARMTVPIALVSLVAGGWWVLRNLVLYGTVSEGSFSRPTVEPFDASVREWIVPWTQGVLRSAMQAAADVLLGQPLLLVLLGVGLLGLAAAGVRVLGWQVALALSLPVVTTLLLWGTRMYLGYTRHGQIAATHARYYFPTIVGVLVVLAAGAVWLHRRHGRAARTATVLALLGFTVWASLLEIRQRLVATWSPDGTIASGWDRVQLWAPAPIAIAWVAVAVLVAGLVVVAVQAARDDTATPHELVARLRTG